MLQFYFLQLNNGKLIAISHSLKKGRRVHSVVTLLSITILI